jgi:hypothetical protein
MYGSLILSVFGKTDYDILLCDIDALRIICTDIQNSLDSRKYKSYLEPIDVIRNEIVNLKMFSTIGNKIATNTNEYNSARGYLIDLFTALDKMYVAIKDGNDELLKTANNDEIQLLTNF